VGQTLKLESDKLQNFDGTTQDRFIIVTKKKPGRQRGNVDLDAIEMPLARIWFYAPPAHPDYSAATDEEKRYGYLSDEQGLVGSPPVLGYPPW